MLVETPVSCNYNIKKNSLLEPQGHQCALFGVNDSTEVDKSFRLCVSQLNLTTGKRQKIFK